jgi:hypothetical protein
VFKIGVERRPDNRLHKASIWVTRTPLRSILRIRSQVLIGSLTLDLVQREGIPPNGGAAVIADTIDEHRAAVW